MNLKENLRPLPADKFESRYLPNTGKKQKGICQGCAKAITSHGRHTHRTVLGQFSKTDPWWLSGWFRVLGFASS
jgi:hypothetical protein